MVERPVGAGGFAGLLRGFRVAAGLSQEELAGRAGVGVRTVGDLERGRVRRPHGQTVMLLADALGLSEAERDELAQAGGWPAGLPGSSGVSGPAGGRVPRQLPSAVPHFAGRAGALRALTGLADAAAGGGAVVISAIDGMAGIGKTALAVQWAHQAAGRFPDGQLYVNLRGFGPVGASVGPGEALRGFLDALGVPATQVPAGVEAQSAMYRSLLAGRRVLVVLDNARDAGQVQPLLPGEPGCLAVVTSRAQLRTLVAAQGAQPLALDVLTAAESLELLTRRLGRDRVSREPAAAGELTGLCAGLPLALNIAAARAAARPAWPLAEVAGQLRDAQRRLDVLDAGDPAADVRAVFSWSVAALSPPAASMFRLIGISPGPDICAPAAAILAGLPPGQARQALDELTTARLLTEQPSGRYALHDLLRDYATELARNTDSTEGIRAALARLTTWYGQQTVAAAHVLQPAVKLPPAVLSPSSTAMTDMSQALNWHETERANLVAAVRQAADLDLHEAVVQIAVALWGFQQWTGYHEDWLAASEIGVSSARILGDDGVLSWLLNSLGQAHCLVGNFTDAGPCLTEALAIRRRTGDRAGEAAVLNSLAIGLGRQGRLEEALEYLEAALAVEVKRSGPQIAMALNNIGHVLLNLKRHDEALDYLHRALAAQPDPGSFEQGVILATRSEVHYDLGQFEDAVDHYRQALAAIQGSVPEHPLHGRVLFGLGGALDRLGRTEEAHNVWRSAIPILDRNNDARADGLRARLTAPSG